MSAVTTSPLVSDAMARFYDKTRPANDGTGCILWTAALQRNGYGKLGVAYRTVMAHRWTRNRKAKLTDDIVRDCRARYAAGTATLTAMAAEYGTSINAMHQAVQGHTWRHVR